MHADDEILTEQITSHHEVPLAGPAPGTPGYRNKRWQILYTPYNVKELNQWSSGVKRAADAWPFDWVNRPPGSHA